MKQAITFNNEIDLLCVFISVIMEIAFHTCIQICFADLGNDIVFKNCPIDRAVGKNFGRTVASQVCHKPGVEEIHLGDLDCPLWREHCKQLTSGARSRS